MALWSRVFLPPSAGNFPGFLTAVPRQWIFFSLDVLVLWAVLAWIWAGPRRRFLHGVEETMGLKIVRGGGRRRGFITRLCQSAGLALPPGPSGETLPVDLPHQEDHRLGQRAGEILASPSHEALLITGPPASGKTRAALELVAGLNPPLVIIYPPGQPLPALPALPTWPGFVVIFAAGLDLDSTTSPARLPPLLEQLVQHCPRALLVATASPESLPRDLPGFTIVRLESTWL